MAVTAKTFSYTAAVDAAGRVNADDGPAADVASDWKPEHLVLAGLIRCTLTSLRYHADRAEIDLARAGGSASGRVTKRESDERYAFVEIECALDVDLDPRRRGTRCPTSSPRPSATASSAPRSRPRRGTAGP